MKAMILAAGFGKRMMPLTKNTPKPLLEVHGKALIAHTIEKLVRAGINEIVINHAYLGEQIEAFCGTGAAFGVHIQYSAEGEPLETAGGIVKALPLLGDEPFIVCNADVFSDFSFSQLLDQRLEQRLAHLILVDNPEQNAEGDFSLQAGNVGVKNQHNLTFSGISLLNPKIFQHYQCFKGRLAPLLNLAAADGLVSGCHYQGVWHDIGTPERLQWINAHN